MSCGKWRLFCLGLNVLRRTQQCINASLTKATHQYGVVSHLSTKIWLMAISLSDIIVNFLLTSMMTSKYGNPFLIPLSEWNPRVIHGSSKARCVYTISCFIVNCTRKNHDDVIKWQHFRATGPLWGETTGHWCFPLVKANDAELWRFLTNRSANSRDAGDLRRHCAHYDVTVMINSCEIRIHIF